MKNTLFSLIFFLCSHTLSSAPQFLDGVYGVIGNQVITHSEINHTLKNLQEYNTISAIYLDCKSAKDIFDKKVELYIVREKLKELGIEVSDSIVENQINNTKARLNLSTDQLEQYLTSKNLTYDDYFELTKMSTEYVYFNQKVIFPLVNISENEIVQYYEKYSKIKDIQSIEYQLYDLIMSLSDYKSFDKKKLQSRLIAMVNSKSNFGPIQFNEIQKIQNQDLPENIQRYLKNLSLKQLGEEPLIIGDNVHFFYIINKKITASEEYKKHKDKIRDILTQQKALEVYKSWFTKNKSQYHVKLTK